MKQKVANFLSLFTSAGTLVCCALPSLLVAVGAGAAVASLVVAAPGLVTLSRHKERLFFFRRSDDRAELFPRLPPHAENSVPDRE